MFTADNPHGQAPQLSKKEEERLKQAETLSQEANQEIRGGVHKDLALVLGYVTEENLKNAKNPRRR
jgi:hypothetical protein